MAISIARLSGLTLVVMWLCIAGVPAVLAGATVDNSNLRVPVSIPIFVPCADGGAGELVIVAGAFHIQSHTTTDVTDGFHSEIMSNPQHLTGVGQVTGDVYHSTGMGVDVWNYAGGDSLPFTFVSVFNFRLVAPGRGNDLIMRLRAHTTINANGETTVDFAHDETECR
jgi:hypothetical protein